MTLRQQIGPQTRTQSVVCGKKDKHHFLFLPQNILWAYWDIHHWLATKPKLPTTFPRAQTQLVAKEHSFTYPFCIHTYTLITIMNGVYRQSVITNKINLWTEHVFRVRPQHSATQSGSSRQRGGQIRKESRLKRQLRRCHYACLPSKGPYPPPRRQKQCLLFYLATGV